MFTQFYNVYIQPQFNCSNIIWGNYSNYNASKIRNLHWRDGMIFLQAEYTDTESTIMGLNILSFDHAVLLNKAKTMYKVVNDIIPRCAETLFQSCIDIVSNASLRLFRIIIAWRAPTHI